MKFIWSLATRELRSSWKRMLFFFICISIGVGAIVALRSVIKNVYEAVAADARALLTADVQVDSNRPWSPETLQIIDRIATMPLVTGRLETVESTTMARPADPRREGAMMIELKGIEPPFPFYGSFDLIDGRPFEYSLIENRGAVVSEALLERLQLRVGDELKIGNSTFQIRGVFDTEPGASGGFRLGPRVFIERQEVETAGLTGFGSRARRKILLRAPDGSAEGLVSSLRTELENSFVNVRSYRDSQENLNERFSRAEDYLSLTGLIILVLGGIGVSNVTSFFIEQKKKTIAVLKCVGASGRKITAAYLAQVLALGLAGSLLGVALAGATLYFLGRYFADSLPKNLSYSLQAGAIMQGLGIGMITTILFSAVPLLRIRGIKPNVLLRDASGTEPRRFDPVKWGVGALVIIGVLMLISWQAGSVRIGVFFLAGVAVTAAVLGAAAMMLMMMVRRLRRFSSFTLRQSISSLYRPGNQTRVIVMAVGLGVFLIVATRSLQENLLSEFDLNRYGQLPNLFLIDIQSDQQEGVAALIESETGRRPVLIPTLRARIAMVNGSEVDLARAETRGERGRLGREYVVTYRPELEANETLVAGEFWQPEPSPEPEVSIEESMVGVSGLDVGSTITFDVQGRKITAQVTSVRKVDWRSSRTGFMVLFRPGVLETAPQMIISAVDGPVGQLERSRFQRKLLDRFPNISIIDVTEIVESVKRIVGNITLGVSFVGGFVFLSGVLILVGSVAMTKFQRIYEAAVLKTLGARRKTLVLIMLCEYGLLGVVAGLIGSLAGEGLSYAASRFVFEIPWQWSASRDAIGITATMLLVVVVGALASIDVLFRKPLAILRAQ